MFRGIKLGHLVEDFCVVLQGLESVGEIFWDVKHPPVFRGELDGEVLLERGRRRTQVDDGVKDRSRCTPHKLRLRKGSGLEMHPAQSAFVLVERNVALGHLRVQPVSLEFPPAKGAGQKAALVFVLLWFNHKRTQQLSIPKNQVSPVARKKSSQELSA
jgi:hypothetical protein